MKGLTRDKVDGLMWLALYSNKWYEVEDGLPPEGEPAQRGSIGG
jgi:hypothetical protein